MGVQYLYGVFGHKQDDAEAAKWFKKAADLGHADAQYETAMNYQDGSGNFPKNETEAFKWFKRSAEQGSAPAQTMLGAYYDLGMGGAAKNETEAAKWFRKSADGGNANGIYNLANYYLEGKGGIAKDRAEATRLYEEAAKKGNANAQRNIAITYYKGEDVTKDIDKAKYWMKKSADNGNEQAREYLPQMADEEKEADFPGGNAAWIAFLEKNINENVPIKRKAPAGSYEVIAQFAVGTEGQITDVTPLTKHGYGMEQEFMRVLNESPKWKPATKNGKPVTSVRKQRVVFDVIEE